MTFPFEITQEIRDAHDDHAAYCSAGQAWLIRNDPDGQTEQELIDTVHDLLTAVAQDHFGLDEDAYEEFYEECLSDSTIWWEMLQEQLESVE
jgi:hypothetical protein